MEANAMIANTGVVKVNRLKLLEVLQNNKKTHVDEFNKAIVQFRKDVIEEMTTLLDRVTKGETLRTGLQQNVMQPVSHEKEYDKAITKYSMSVDDEIYLNDPQFDQLVMDNWQWKNSTSNSYYATRSNM
jgi:hypothetical protein